MPTADAAALSFAIDQVTPAAFAHAVTHLRVIETHISWVVLTGPYAYKIKKPVRFDFLDAGTLERRQALCNEELRLNRRLAPDLYLDVLPVVREAGHLRFGGNGPVVEYAVRMHEFDPGQELGNQLAMGAVSVGEMTALGCALAEFHRQAAVAAPDSPFGDVASVRGQILDNMTVLEAHADASQDMAALRRLDEWLRQAVIRSAALISERKLGGAVRECHGDLHARNIVRWRGRWTPFDCIEFNPDLRWIDMVSDVAFLFMDLAAHRRHDLAHALLSRYLEDGGDYPGLRLLPLHAVYRALVRAKIDALAAQAVSAERAQVLRAREALRVRVATELMSHRQPALLITHGLTASGKSWLSERLVPAVPALRVRADLERKRLARLGPLESSHSGVAEKLYAAAVTDRAYERLTECADAALAAGFKVVVDASFLRAGQRERFRQLAAERRVPFLILSCHADVATLDARLEARAHAGRDPSEATRAVLDYQLTSQEPLTPTEQAVSVVIDSTRLTLDAGIEAIKARLRDLS
ncbi:MAG TPA: AAA family ATPase [Steroidobacteraceae bacterium]|nr:AAA family ATPase [Steroidobacteraceae bacterium]